MGLSTKQVPGDHQGLLIDWGGGGQAMMQSSGAAELSKPPSVRRHQPPTQQQSEPPLKCPRCASTNTKFCYYNNYNKSQPRHFCKSCKRHWTKGGTLRNVPVGGGRKNKRPKISNPTPTTAATSAAGVRQEEKQKPNFPLSTANIIGDHQKSMSTILYQSLIPTSSPLLHEATRDCISANIGVNGGADSTISTGLNNQNTEFHEFTSLSTFDHMNASLGPTSYHSLNMFDHYPGNLDSMEESTITTVNNNIPSSSSSAPLWTGPNTTSSLELPNYWNWNEIDALTSSDHLNISWDDHDDDDAEVKP